MLRITIWHPDFSISDSVFCLRREHKIKSSASGENPRSSLLLWGRNQHSCPVPEENPRSSLLPRGTTQDLVSCPKGEPKIQSPAPGEIPRSSLLPRGRTQDSVSCPGEEPNIHLLPRGNPTSSHLHQGRTQDPVFCPMGDPKIKSPALRENSRSSLLSLVRTQDQISSLRENLAVVHKLCSTSNNPIVSVCVCENYLKCG